MKSLNKLQIATETTPLTKTDFPDSSCQTNTCSRDVISICNARTHNLKNVSLQIPHRSLTVVTGVSGSGKSSLAFDTLFAEGQRQYIESLSIYARQFLDQLARPDVDAIDGLQPTLCIDQRTGTRNPRSTVGTISEIYDFLRLLMAKVGTPSCFNCGCRITQQSTDDILTAITELPLGTRLVMLSPVVRGRKGSHREAIDEIRKCGLVRLRVDGELYDIDAVPELAVRKEHSLDAVVDKIVIRDEARTRISTSIDLALRLSGGLVSVSYLPPEASQNSAPNIWHERLFSTLFSCPDCGTSYLEIEPRTFSFNSPYGACPDCEGMGELSQFDSASFIVDWNKSIAAGGCAIYDSAPNKIKKRLKKELSTIIEELGIAWENPPEQLKSAGKKKLLQKLSSLLLKYSDGEYQDSKWLGLFQSPTPCPSCQGSRLRREALAVRIDNKNIFELTQQSLAELSPWLADLSLNSRDSHIAKPIVNGALHRVAFLNQVGVGYLTLNRRADSLSGGELQRVRLATSIGSGLTGVCYVLDEPSIGLHPRDNDRLIDSLKNLQSQGNTVVVVEHDEHMMRHADQLVDLGPGAGRSGGHITAVGIASEFVSSSDTLTAQYLRGERIAYLDRQVRPYREDGWIRLTGASLHNLKRVKCEIPLGKLVGVTGVSGSGKSSLVGHTVVPALLRGLKMSHGHVGPYESLEGCELLDKIIEIDQSPIGRTPRSTPATYSGVYDKIRAVWAGTRESKQRGFSSSRFSFNSGDGRCPQCLGQGQEKIEMNFLPDVYVTCSTCSGRRFNRQTLQVRYRGQSIADVLEFTVDEALEFFENFETIVRILESMQRVGLGYLTLGQSSSTLSGGEAQRIKLSSELARPATGKTLYYFDEPTTGLHFEDIRKLLIVLDDLVERGNTVVVVEHNLDIIRSCDWLIDLGPGGGREGGEIVATGPPLELARQPHSETGRYLQSLFETANA
ncbi:MAG: excinuclease ABC subunit UvrA [Planctomycetales bacterium]|nr:excinuclease ABC subunit UvrA [Planctomycetales bacterium]